MLVSILDIINAKDKSCGFYQDVCYYKRDIEDNSLTKYITSIGAILYYISKEVEKDISILIYCNNNDNFFK